MKSRRLIKLTAKTHKGKNRIKENGNIWEVIHEGIMLNHVMVNIPGDNDSMFICPVDNELNARWIKIENDPNFEWTEIYRPVAQG